MNKPSCNNNDSTCNNRFGDLFIILVLFILLAIIVSAVYSY